MSNRRYRGRFAPSPTGSLHFGSLCTALGSYLEARSRDGQWLVRIEDLDPPREVPGATDDILLTLDAFGFEWDGQVEFQSRRHAAYDAAVMTLLEEGLAYPCTCSRQDVARAGTPGAEGPVYPGTCRSGSQRQGKRRSIRVLTEGSKIGFTDRFQGSIYQMLERQSGDFVIRRADGLTAYQLAVVLDDAWQGITDVVRGADLLRSTPRQIHLQRLLGLDTPRYAHLPLVLDSNGRKLSKQDGARPVQREYPLRTLTAAYRFLGQAPSPYAIGKLSEFWEWAVGHWDAARIPTSSAPAELGDAHGAGDRGPATPHPDENLDRARSRD